MIQDEMDLLATLKDVEPLSGEACAAARERLRTAINKAAGERVAVPRRRVRASRAEMVARAAASVGVAGAALAVGVAATSGHHPTIATHRLATAGSSAASHTAASRLVRLVAYLKANETPEPGDATLVLRTQSYPDRPSITGADLYTDSGEYFYAPTESGLPAAIASNDNIGGGMFAREVKAAEDAVNGDLATASQEMANAPFPDGVRPTQSPKISPAETAVLAKLGAKVPSATAKPTVSPQAQTDNYIWMDSMDALSAGAGNSEVRIGVLRILSTLSEVTVTSGTAAGQPTLTLTASAPALPANYHEALTINATTGIPVSFVGGVIGQTPAVTVSYQVSRVSVSNIAKGDF